MTFVNWTLKDYDHNDHDDHDNHNDHNDHNDHDDQDDYDDGADHDDHDDRDDHNDHDDQDDDDDRADHDDHDDHDDPPVKEMWTPAASIRPCTNNLCAQAWIVISFKMMISTDSNNLRNRDGDAIWKGRDAFSEAPSGPWQ